MAKLTWNAAKLRNLKYCAESSTNAQAIVYFSPLLKNMSKHGHCAANIKRCCKMTINMNSHKYVNYDHPGECSPEKDCLW